MDHVAIMKKSWGLLPKILSGQKTIESRWYLNKSVPWGKIKVGEIVYFKNSGEPVTVKATVSKVTQIEDLTPKKVKEIIDQYGDCDGIGIDDQKKFYELFKNKKYCLLIFLKDPKTVKPFEINKKGFGMMAAWITVNNVKKISQPVNLTKD